jgi:hypothetical protein
MKHNDFAIILQGKVYINTEKIIDYYNNAYDCKLILSTHTNCINFDITKYDRLVICENDAPLGIGIGNRNIQRISTFYGLQKAKELGIKYCLKSRTDHFFKHPKLIEILKHNLKSFTIYNNVPSYGQQERIVVPNGGTTLNYWCGGANGRGGAFHISDHWLCGTTDDLYNYFDINNPFWKAENSSNFSTSEHPVVATEVEFCRLWMKAQNIDYDCVSEILRDRFIVLDNQSLYYDQVKTYCDDITNIKTNWIAWCDPLAVHSRLWFQFWLGKVYTKEQELEFNRLQSL